MKPKLLCLSVVFALLLSSLAPVTATQFNHQPRPQAVRLSGPIQSPPPPFQKAQPGDLSSSAFEGRSSAGDQLPPDLQAKVDPRILQELNGAVIPAHLGGRPDRAEVAAAARKPLDKTRFLVYLKAKADLKATMVQPSATLAQQRAAVADALISTAQATQAPVKVLLDTRMAAGNVASYQPFYIFNGFAVEGNWDTVVELSQRDDVEKIVANYPLIKLDQPTRASVSPADGLGGLDPANWNIDLVDADRVWNELGVRGEGAVVGDLDTGVQWDHPALMSKYRGWNGASANHNYNWFAPDSNLYPGGNLGPSVSSVPTWCDDHGIHTMGTMVGDGGTPDTKIGMAPGAKWIAVPGICYITMPGGWGDDIGGNKAFEWFLCPTDLTGNLATRDCSKAPDVVNNSWGSSNPADDTFRPAIQALRAAGIAPVFAAGNPDAGPGSIGSPASNPEAITVGATDMSDAVASFSGRGPSFYEGVQKPNVTAPGVNVYSSVSGDDYESGWSGTSMAAPAVSGLIALMVSADLKDGRRDLTLDELQKFVELTAVKLGTGSPNDDYGYGRIDAYHAVRWVLSAGDLRGLIVDANSSTPIDGATIAGVKTPDTFTTRSAANGAYSVTVPGGLYNVTVSAFGFNSGIFSGVSVITGVSSIVNLALTPQPAANLTGAVLSGTTPVSGTLIYVDARPSVSFRTGANGMYTLTLPVGTHAMTVKVKGYRILHENVTVASGGSAHNLALTPAPTVLLVEADSAYGWFYGRPAHNFFQWSLDQRNYLYDTTAITDTTSLISLNAVMTPTNYGAVIWIHTAASPGYGGYTTLLQNYLDAGGRLILSGQGIGQWDSGSWFFQNTLHATYLRDSAAGIGDKVSGRGFLDGLNLTLAESPLYSYANSAMGLFPDAVAARDGNAYPVMTYDNGNGAGALAVDPCNAPYRAVYFAVGYENLGPRAYSRPPAYADVLDRSLQWVTAKKSAYSVETLVIPNRGISPPGSVLTYQLTVANRGINTDTYNLAFAGNTWPMRIISDTDQVTQTLKLAACGQQVLGLEVTIPGTTSLGVMDTFTAIATSQASPVITSAVSAKTTAFTLWQNETAMPTKRYRLGATALPGAFYYFAIGGQDEYGAVATNERYDACSSTWAAMAPMPARRGNVMAAALNGKIYVVGGYDSNYYYDYYYDSNFVYNPTTNTWSSAARLPMALSGVAIAAANGKLYAFGGRGNNGLSGATYEYDPVADKWTGKSPMPGGARAYASAATVGGKVYVVGGWVNLNKVEVYDPSADRWATATPLNVGRQSPGLVTAPDGYLYVSGGGNGWMGLNSAERYNPATNTWANLSSLDDASRAGSASAYVAGRVFAVGGAVDYYISRANESLAITDAFCQSAKRAQPAIAQPGERITYTIELHSDAIALTNASVRDPIPNGTTFGGFGPATVSPAPTFNSVQHRVEWNGSIPANQPPVTFTFGVLANPGGWVNGQRITNTASFSNSLNLTFNRAAVSTISIMDLSASTKSVNKTQATEGGVLIYTLHIQDKSLAGGSVTLSDPLPSDTTFVPDSLTYTVGSAGYTNGVITWTSQVLAMAVYANTSGGYQWGDSNGNGVVPGVNYDWIEISNSGALVNFRSSDDDYHYPIALPFAFNFYGTDYTNLAVATNGTVYFEDGYLGYLNTPIPSSNSYGVSRYMAHFWDDLVVSPGAVYYAVQGTAPNRRMVIEYYHVSGWSSFDYGTWEIILYEGSNIILLQYQDVTFGTYSYDNGAGATVGIQNTPSQGIQYSYYTPSLSNGLAILFLPPGSSHNGGPNMADISFAVTAAAPLPINTWITNTTTFADNLNVVYQRSAGTLINTVSLSTSRQIASRAEAGVGDRVNYTAWLVNTGSYTATGASLSDPIPANTIWNGSAPACTMGTCGFASGVITWTGDVPPGATVAVSFGVTYTTPLPDRTPVTNTATISDGLGNVFARQTVFLARTPNMGTSYKTVNPTMPSPGERVTYTIYVYNSGGTDGDAQLVDPIPSGLTYVPGSLVYGSGSGRYAAGLIAWSGTVPARSQIPVIFQATVNSSVAKGQTIVNTATITDVMWATAYQRSALIGRYKTYLPVVFK